MGRVIICLMGILCVAVTFGQLPKSTVQPQRGFSFNFSNEQFKNFPQVVYVWPLSDAERAGLKRGMVIARVNDTWFAKMSQEKIIEFLTNLSTQPLVFYYLDKAKSAESTPVMERIGFGPYLPPVQSGHPDGTCISGDCLDGEGYLRFTNRDYYRGTFRAGKPIEGEFYLASTASRKKIPEVVDTTYKDYLVDIATADGVGGYKFKRLYANQLNNPPDIIYEGGRIYRGELKGLIPHGKGSVQYDNYKIADPNIGTAIYAPMVLEGVFENGKFVKATRLRTTGLTGMFIEGGISAGLKKHIPFWHAYNASLKVWSYRDFRNNPVDEERTIFKSKDGNFCINGEFNGPGTWYCNQFGYSPLYGGHIEILNMTGGFVQDSVELVLPHLNYRKKFSVANGARKFLRLDLLEYYIELYYISGKPPGGNWNTAMGNFVVKPAPPPQKIYKVSDYLGKVANIYKQNFNREFGGRMELVSEGAVVSDDFLERGVTLGEYLDYGQIMGFLVFTLENAPVEVISPKGNCKPTPATTKEVALQVQVFDCDYTQEQQTKSFFANTIKFSKPGTELYYLLYRLEPKKP